MRTSSGHMLLVAVLFSLFLSACLRGKDEIAPSSVDATAPAVIATTPLDSVKLGPSHTTITATFSEDMNPATLTTATFAVSADGKPVAGTVSYTYKTAVFTPAGDLDLNKLYTVTITTAAKDAAGNALVAPYTWSFTPGVALLERDDTGDAEVPRIAMDADGNALAVWQQWDSVNHYWKIKARRYAADRAEWDARVEDVSSGKGDARNPQIAMTPGGDAWVVWQQHDDSLSFPVSSIWASHYDAITGQWGAATLIKAINASATEVLVNADTPQVAVSATGQAIIVWHQLDGPFCTAAGAPVATNCNPSSQQGQDRYNVGSVVASRYSGGVWSGPERLEEDNLKGHNAEQPRAVIDSSGNAVVLWQQTIALADGTLMTNIYANRYAGVAWAAAPVLVEHADEGAALDPQIVQDSGGNVIAVWRQADSSGRYSIWSNRYVSGAWGTAALMEKDNRGDVNAPQIAINANGDAIAVWRQFDGARHNIWANRFSSVQNAWAGEALIETDNAGDASEPAVSLNGNGDAVAMWSQYDGVHWNIWANRYTAGGWSVAALAEENDAGDAHDPQPAISNGGNVISVWRQRGGSRWSIWQRRF